MRWAVRMVVRDTVENDVNALIEEAATYGREVASVVLLDPDHLLTVFRPIPRAPAHVTATIVDRDGYAR